MRKNLPVTDVEYPIGEDVLIVSKTDTKGKLTYFNEQFVRVSGFTDAELMGQPHNIVRHPDMPPEAFVDLWDTLKAGKPWAGAVKNRRKNGDFYWVLASATPVWENGHVTGYMSIRTRLPADQRAEAEHVYKLLREKKAQKYAVAAGTIRRRSMVDRFAVFTRTLRARIATLGVFQTVLLIAVGLAGIWTTRDGNLQMKSIYEDRTIPLSYLFDINDRMKDNTIALYDGLSDARAGRSPDGIAARVEANMEMISKTWAKYLESEHTSEERIAAETFAPKRKEYVEKALKPGLVMLADRKFEQLDALLASTAHGLYGAAKTEMDKLVAIQLKEGKSRYENADRQYIMLLVLSVGLLFAGLLLCGWIGFMTIRAISRPLQNLNEIMGKVAQGLFNNRVVVERDDEIGVALRSVQAMQAKLGFDREAQKDTERRVALQRKADMRKLADDFDSAIGEIVQTVSSASTELEAAAGNLTKTADDTQSLSTMVASASEEASANVQSVASASEEMASSVHEISRQVQEAAKIAGEAVEQAHQTNDRVNALSQAAARIGDVVELINTIAGQTNLLALNATIEAARAGEAGRGFAVVAAEVKSLAEQTAKATGEISQQIDSIQSATQDSVLAIREIGGTIGRISEISSAIAAAVEEQGAATREISRNVQQAAQGTHQVASSVTEVQRGASETGSASSQVLASAQSLSSESNRLKVQVAEFLESVRAA